MCNITLMREQSNRRTKWMKITVSSPSKMSASGQILHTKIL
uniref:Uncharacterized protein n=1 Tax=Rhizophora mucronata TaxID=61149 RepID=A0A2P2IYP0_RHIMU